MGQNLIFRSFIFQYLLLNRNSLDSLVIDNPVIYYRYDTQGNVISITFSSKSHAVLTSKVQVKWPWQTLNLMQFSGYVCTRFCDDLSRLHPVDINIIVHLDCVLKRLICCRSWPFYDQTFPCGSYFNCPGMFLEIFISSYKNFLIFVHNYQGNASRIFLVNIK